MIWNSKHKFLNTDRMERKTDNIHFYPVTADVQHQVEQNNPKMLDEISEWMQTTPLDQKKASMVSV